MSYEDDILQLLHDYNFWIRKCNEGDEKEEAAAQEQDQGKRSQMEYDNEQWWLLVDDMHKELTKTCEDLLLVAESLREDLEELLEDIRDGLNEYVQDPEGSEA